jgi:hypothetical protein
MIRLVLAGCVFGVTYLTLCPILGAIGIENLASIREISKDMGLISKLLGKALSYEERLLFIVCKTPINGNRP